MTTGPGRRRPDESMTLLTSMLERPLDAGYQESADRRVAAGLPPATPTRTAFRSQPNGGAPNSSRRFFPSVRSFLL